MILFVNDITGHYPGSVLVEKVDVKAAFNVTISGDDKDI